MKFILNGCDISFVAEAPEDITLKQLLKQIRLMLKHFLLQRLQTATAQLKKQSRRFSLLFVKI